MVHSQWVDCIRYNVDFEDPFYCNTKQKYIKILARNQTMIEKKGPSH